MASINSDDTVSPYYLHHSDSPGLVLVSQPLTGDNFTSWYRAMIIALSVKNKLGFVDGSISKPIDSDSNLLSSWKRNNNIVISWILNSVSKDISASIIFAESASEIWQDLKDRFMQSNGPRLFQLHRELINHRQGNLSVSVYFTKLKTVWEELNSFRPQCVCGHCCEGIKRLESHHQVEYVLAFLMGLNESFSQVRSQVLLLDPLPSINKVFSMIIQEERQRQIGLQASNSADEMALAVKGDNFKSSGNQYRRNVGSNNRNLSTVNNEAINKFGFNSSSRYQPRDRPFCSACNIHGHTTETCYKIHGYPTGYKSRFKNSSYNRSHIPVAPVNQVSDQWLPPETNSENNQEFFQSLDKNQYTQLMSMFAKHLSATDNSQNISGENHSTGTCFSFSVPHTLISPQTWIVDSGASRHICSNMADFISMRSIPKSVVTLPNHMHIDVNKCGDVKINDNIILRDVLFVPEFKFNLFSVGSFITNPEMMIRFFYDRFLIQDIYLRKTIGRGRRVNNLYILDREEPSETKKSSETSSVHASETSPVNATSVQIWHNRLGHPSNKVLALLRDHLQYKGHDLQNIDPCYICPLAKQKRLPFISNHNMSNLPFELVHCDIWGPLHSSTLHDQRYFFTIVDDCTRFTWVFLLHNKSDAPHRFSRFYTMIDTQFNSKIKAVRTDNAKELAFTEFGHQTGMVHQFSCVQRPEQNSVVERKHQHLLNVARSLYFQSRVPIKFWGECVLTATFLVNRTPSVWLKHRSPYELLYKHRFDYSTLKVFGCLAFASTLQSHRHKFQARARACVFLGYPPGTKGYKLYDIQTSEVFVSRDVVFHEEIFPFHSIIDSEKMIDSFQDLVLPKTMAEVVHEFPVPNQTTDMPSEQHIPIRSSTRVHQLHLIFKIITAIYCHQLRNVHPKLRIP